MEEDVLRTWNCRNCGRSNKTVFADDGMAKCEFCSNLTRIQPSRYRGQETAAQLSLSNRKKPMAPATRAAVPKSR